MKLAILAILFGIAYSDVFSTHPKFAHPATGLGGDGTDLVRTPHGYRPSKCVHRVDENEPEAHLYEVDGGVEVYYANSKRTIFFKEDSYCVENAQFLGAYQKQRMLGNIKSPDVWVDYVSYTTPAQVGTVNSTYTIPMESPAPEGKELLYFFDGFQNNGEPDLSIIQPVVNYCADCGDNNFPNGWSMAPWNCCPSGQTWTGNIVNTTEGAKITTWTMAGDDTINIGMMNNPGQGVPTTPAVLSVSANRRKFNWAACTLEQYSVETCDQYNSKPFLISDLVFVDSSGKSFTPQWMETGDAKCQGGVVHTNPLSVQIYGTKMPSN